MKFNKGKYQAMHRGKNNPKYQCRLRAEQLWNRIAEEDLDVLMDSKLAEPPVYPWSKES